MNYVELYVQASRLEASVRDTAIENFVMKLEIELLRHRRDVLKLHELEKDRILSTTI